MLQYRWLAPLAIYATLLFFFWQPIEDFDIWFYMVSGREIADTGRIPDTMSYLLPLLGEPASYIEWGFGLLYYLAHILGGYTGMNALNAAFGATTMLLVYRAAIGKRGWLHPVALLALACVSWVISVRFNYRAETALLLSMAATLFVLERYAADGDWLTLLPIPIIGWVLVQLHPSVLFLLPLLGAYAVEFFFSPPRDRTRFHAILTLAIFAAVTLGLACINPYGWRQVALPFIAVLSSTSQMNGITEFLPVMDTEYSYSFVLMVALSMFALVFQRERRISSGLLIVLFGTLTFLYVRNIGLFALVLLMPLVRSGLNVMPEIASPYMRRSCSMAVLSALIIIAMWQGKWGSGIKQGMFPEQSAINLKKLMAEGHVFNFYDYGGYLAWALGSGFLVFVDGHDTKINLAVQLHDKIFRADPGWQGTLSRYRIDAIITPAVLKFSGRMIPLVEHLASSSEWRLIGRETAGLLFLRADLAYEKELDKRQVWEQMIEEAQIESGKFPEHPEPWYAMSTAYRALGDIGQAEEAMKQYRSLSN